jgi:heme exporter protein A
VRRSSALFGHASYAYEPLTAVENLELFARLTGRDARRASLLSRLDEVGLGDRADSAVQGFSQGMQRRLALARLLLQEPRVALLDEPHSALDAEGARQIDEMVRSLKRRGVAVVIASHAIDRAAPLCEQGIVLERGRIQWSGPALDMATASSATLAAAQGAV